MKSIALLAIMLAAGVASAQSTGAAQPPEIAPSPPDAPSFQYRFGGSFRNLLTTSSSYFTGNTYGDNLDRLRLSFESSWRHALVVHVEYDSEAHFGNLIGEPDFDLVRRRQNSSYLDLQHVWVDEKHAYWDTSLYRGYLTLRNPRAQLTVGRERIAWGTAHFWSPTDIFNPISPLQIESDERQGVDAAQLTLRLPRDVRWSVVYAPQDGLDRSTEAMRLTRTVHNFDVAAIGGHFRQDWMAGGNFAGQWHGAGLRGEITYTWRADSKQPNALRWTVGSDYALNDKWYLIGEYFYNQGQLQGPAPGQSLPLSVINRFSNEIFTLQRHFISLGTHYSVTPLLNLQIYEVIDPVGPSVFFMPVASYNVTTNTDLSVGGQLFASSSSGEFYRARNLVYLELTVHF